MVKSREFYTASALSAQHIGLSAYRSKEDDIHGYYSEIVEYNENDPHGTWRYRVIPQWVDSLACYKTNPDAAPVLAGITFQGSAFILDDSDESELIYAPDVQEGFGLSRLRQIGGRLYACGLGGRVFRREQANDWRLIKPNIVSIEYLSHPDFYFIDINGVSEDEMYIASKRGLSFFDGKTITPIPNVPPNIIEIHAEKDGNIWACGWGGVVIHGNHRDGFRRIDNPNGN